MEIQASTNKIQAILLKHGGRIMENVKFKMKEVQCRQAT